MLDRVTNRLRRINAIYYPQRVFQAPKWLVLGVNNSCNLHCKMCDVGVSYTQSNFYANLMGSTPVHMPFELFEKITDQASRSFPSVKLGFAFTEPLIYAHLEKALFDARKKKLFTSITTNGLGLKKWADAIAASNVSEVNVSLDGPPDIHNFIRGNAHSFNKAVEGIEELAKRTQNITIRVFCVITEWNVNHLTAFLKSLKNLPIELVGLMHSNFTPESVAAAHNLVYGELCQATATNVSDTHNEAINTEFLWKEIVEIKKHKWDFPVRFYPEIGSRERLEDYYRHPEVFFGKRCMDIFSNIMIKSNGDVIPSHGRCYNLKIGNLYENDLKEIWNGEPITQFRKTLTKNGGLLPACSRCCSSFV